MLVSNVPSNGALICFSFCVAAQVLSFFEDFIFNGRSLELHFSIPKFSFTIPVHRTFHERRLNDIGKIFPALLTYTVKVNSHSPAGVHCSTKQRLLCCGTRRIVCSIWVFKQFDWDMSYHCNLVSYSINPKIIHCSATYWRIAVSLLLFLILYGSVFSVFPGQLLPRSHSSFFVDVLFHHSILLSVCFSVCSQQGVTVAVRESVNP